MAEGAFLWLIPDGYLPEVNPDGMGGDLVSHEAICVLNTGAEDATLLITFYFEDRPPVRDVRVVVPAERTRHVRTDQPEQVGGNTIPRGVPYAVRVASDRPVVVQHSRLDTSAPALALMTTLAHPVDPVRP